MRWITPSPFRDRFIVGQINNYFIRDGYEHRAEVPAFDDTPFEAEFQGEVYQYARQVADAEKFARVMDIGCGSGFKLVTVFFDRETLGVDSPATVDFLNRRWPGRAWKTSDFSDLSFQPELLICSDVIEHVLDPNALLKYFRDLRPRRIVLSTPAREQLCIGTDCGPPKNIHHVREWAMQEFHAYLKSQFRVREHFIVNGTQVADLELIS